MKPCLRRRGIRLGCQVRFKPDCLSVPRQYTGRFALRATLRNEAYPVAMNARQIETLRRSAASWVRTIRRLDHIGDELWVTPPLDALADTHFLLLAIDHLSKCLRSLSDDGNDLEPYRGRFLNSWHEQEIA